MIKYFGSVVLFSVVVLGFLISCTKSSQTSNPKFIGTWTLTRLAVDYNMNGRIDSNEWKTPAQFAIAASTLTFNTDSSGVLYTRHTNDTINTDSFTWRVANDTLIRIYQNGSIYATPLYIDTLTAKRFLYKTYTTVNNALWYEYTK